MSLFIHRLDINLDVRTVIEGPCCFGVRLNVRCEFTYRGCNEVFTGANAELQRGNVLEPGDLLLFLPLWQRSS